MFLSVRDDDDDSGAVVVAGLWFIFVNFRCNLILWPIFVLQSLFIRTIYYHCSSCKIFDSFTRADSDNMAFFFICLLILSLM